MSRKEIILEKAIQLFKKQGKDQTSIRQIANEAGVSHSLLHKHWDSKDSLFLDSIEVEVSRLRGVISSENSRVENTLYFLLKYPEQWTLIARCLSMAPPTSGEERRMHAKVDKRIQPLLDDLMLLTRAFSEETENGGSATVCQSSKAWFFLIVSVFSGHCLLRRSLESYLGESDLHVARRVTIDTFYENWIFKQNRVASL